MKVINNNIYIAAPYKANKHSERSTTHPEAIRHNTKLTYNHILASKGINFKSRSINELYDEYNWYINHDHTPAINALLKIKADKESMDSFLTAVLNTDDRGYQLIDSIVRQPRNTKEILSSLKDKVGENSKNVMTFFMDSPYNKAYDKYLNRKFENAHTLSELLRVRPDWKGDMLLEKHRQLKHNDFLEIGSIPKEFPSDHVFKITDYLSGFMEEGMKQSKKVDNLKLDNREYEFKFFTEGRSDKNVFGVFTPERKKYVFKMASPKSRSLDNPFALGTLAKIDTYLTTNRSRNSAPLSYYNHDRNFSIYKYIEHTPIPTPSKDLTTIKNHLPDFSAMGLSYNDTVGHKNFFLLNRGSNEDLINNAEGIEEAINKGEWISVDNDHVTFNESLQPGIRKYTTQLPNAMQMFF